VFLTIIKSVINFYPGGTMPRQSDKRERLVRAAKLLLLKKGYNETTLADIAQEADVPLGNVYYYFKTKEAIGDAVIIFCLGELQQRLLTCDAAASPVERLCAYVEQEVQDVEWTLQYGDKYGSLCQELAKQGGALASASCNLMRASLDWMQKQFQDMGRDSNCAARDARCLMARLQGMNLMVATFNSRESMEDLTRWVNDSLRRESSGTVSMAEEVSRVEAFA